MDYLIGADRMRLLGRLTSPVSNVPIPLSLRGYTQMEHNRPVASFNLKVEKHAWDEPQTTIDESSVLGQGNFALLEQDNDSEPSFDQNYASIPVHRTPPRPGVSKSSPSTRQGAKAAPSACPRTQIRDPSSPHGTPPPAPRTNPPRRLSYEGDDLVTSAAGHGNPSPLRAKGSGVIHERREEAPRNVGKKGVAFLRSIPSPLPKVEGRGGPKASHPSGYSRPVATTETTVSSTEETQPHTHWNTQQQPSTTRQAPPDTSHASRFQGPDDDALSPTKASGSRHRHLDPDKSKETTTRQRSAPGTPAPDSHSYSDADLAPSGAELADSLRMPRTPPSPGHFLSPSRESALTQHGDAEKPFCDDAGKSGGGNGGGDGFAAAAGGSIGDPALPSTNQDSESPAVSRYAGVVSFAQSPVKSPWDPNKQHGLLQINKSHVRLPLEKVGRGQAAPFPLAAVRSASPLSNGTLPELPDYLASAMTQPGLPLPIGAVSSVSAVEPPSSSSRHCQPGRAGPSGLSFPIPDPTIPREDLTVLSAGVTHCFPTASSSQQIARRRLAIHAGVDGAGVERGLRGLVLAAAQSREAPPPGGTVIIPTTTYNDNESQAQCMYSACTPSAGGVVGAAAAAAAALPGTGSFTGDSPAEHTGAGNGGGGFLIFTSPEGFLDMPPPPPREPKVFRGQLLPIAMSVKDRVGMSRVANKIEKLQIPLPALCSCDSGGGSSRPLVSVDYVYRCGRNCFLYGRPERYEQLLTGILRACDVI